MSEAVEVAISEMAEDFEWTMAAVKMIGSAPEVEVTDIRAAERFETWQASEDEETPEEPQATEIEETEVQWKGGTDDKEPASSDPASDFDEESGVSELSFEETAVDMASARSTDAKRP